MIALRGRGLNPTTWRASFVFKSEEESTQWEPNQWPTDMPTDPYETMGWQVKKVCLKNILALSENASLSQQQKADNGFQDSRCEAK